jgi:hypothetical protein
MEEKIIRQRVKDYYWQHDLNCTTVTLKILAEQYSLELSDQVLDSCVGMHGAGNYGAQCGLIEGTLLFLGILGRAKQLPDDEICNLCCQYAGRFEEHFASLQCSELRPEGFSSELPPHLCEELSSRAVIFGSAFLKEMLTRHQ